MLNMQLNVIPISFGQLQKRFKGLKRLKSRQRTSVAYARLQRRIRSCKAKGNLMSNGPRLFLQKFPKCAPSVLLSFIKVIFDNFLTMVYIGCAYSRSDCSSNRAQIENHVNMFASDSESTFEQVISKSIRRASSGDKHLNLKSLGRSMSVKVDAKQEAQRIFSSEDAIKMKLEAELSDRQILPF